MEATIVKPFLPYQVFSATILPDDDLTMTFQLMRSQIRPINDCSNAILVQCTEQGVVDVIQSATLVWKNCGGTEFIDVDPDDIVTQDGKTMSLSVDIDDIFQAEKNDFELQVDTGSGTFIIARGRVFL